MKANISVSTDSLYCWEYYKIPKKTMKPFDDWNDYMAGMFTHQRLNSIPFWSCGSAIYWANLVLPTRILVKLQSAQLIWNIGYWMNRKLLKWYKFADYGNSSKITMISMIMIPIMVLPASWGIHCVRISSLSYSSG